MIVPTLPHCASLLHLADIAELVDVGEELATALLVPFVSMVEEVVMARNNLPPLLQILFFPKVSHPDGVQRG